MSTASIQVSKADGHSTDFGKMSHPQLFSLRWAGLRNLQGVGPFRAKQHLQEGLLQATLYPFESMYPFECLSESCGQGMRRLLGSGAVDIFPPDVLR